MRKRIFLRSRGQVLVLVVLVAVALVAFIALAIDGGNAYAARRQAQSAADAGALAGTRVMIDYQGFTPATDILCKVNGIAEDNGIADTNGDPADATNDNVRVYYVDAAGERLSLNGEDWELHNGPDIIPAEARGVEARTVLTRTTFFARVVGVTQIGAAARAAARYEAGAGILPIAVNEYWLGSQGHCPYDHCGLPYSYVRDPDQPPPFLQLGSIWRHNDCNLPYVGTACQGPYDGQGENFGQAFAILGQDAVPNSGSLNPRSAVEMDYRFDALVSQGYWNTLQSCDNQGNCTWLHDTKPIASGQGKQDMQAVFLSGGYRKGLPNILLEPAPAYLDRPGYCWASPPNADNCFNAPAQGRPAPYDVLQFLDGTDAAKLAQTLYDGGNYVHGRYEPGQRIAILFYNSVTGDQWGPSGKQSYAAAVYGYIGVVIVGYGNNFRYPCLSGVPGDWASYARCVHGQPNTVYGLVPDCYYYEGGVCAAKGVLTDPSVLLDHFLPQQITLIR